MKTVLADPTAVTRRPWIQEPTVRIERLTKRFRVRRSWLEMLRHPRRSTYVPAVQDVSFDVRDGEFFGLLGPNGAGKTTLFKMLSTLIIPDGGTATVAGHDLLRDAPQIRKVLSPVIADERSLNWRLSAWENLRFHASLHGLSGSTLRGRVEELLQAVELADTGRKIVGGFSSGMKQRLLLARALLARPRVLLLDEPTRSLDPLSARRFRSFLRNDIAERQQCAVLLATHNAEEALELCDRVAVLDQGRLLAIGTPDELSQGLGDAQYRVWTRNPNHPAFATLAGRGFVSFVSPASDTTVGWNVVELGIEGGEDRAMEVLTLLVESGAEIARFERTQVTLADLIEHVLSRQNQDDRRA